MANRPARWCIRSFYFVVLVLLVTGLLHAQEVTGTIRGNVTDPRGGRVTHAQLSATQLETGLTRKAETDTEGNYLLVLLPVGHYRLEAVASGFRKYVQSGITLSVNPVAIVPLQL